MMTVTQTMTPRFNRFVMHIYIAMSTVHMTQSLSVVMSCFLDVLHCEPTISVFCDPPHRFHTHRHRQKKNLVTSDRRCTWADWRFTT